MKIKSIQLKRFKRFSDLLVTNIPKKAKVIILAGPNGCGKSSLFDALNLWHRQSWRGLGGWTNAYHQKQDKGSNIAFNDSVKVEFFNPQPNTPAAQKKAIYIRSAYRNEAEFKTNQLRASEPAVDVNRLARLIDDDKTVSLNYQRLVSNAFADVFERSSASTTIGKFREETIGAISKSFSNIFPEIKLNSLGDPLVEGTFKFDKGVSKSFLYTNLSGGEKAVFDLILDLIVKKREYDNTVFCIDEPEAHMNTKLQGKLFAELFRLIDNKSQLWIATHSIGMMRQAQELATKYPNQIVFLDLDHKDFDKQQVLEPVVPTRAFWNKIYDIALDDLSTLIAPKTVVLCEGKPIGTGGRNEAFDAKCYEKIFDTAYPTVRFISCGSSTEVEADKLALIAALQSLSRGTKVIRLIDGDDHSIEDIAEKRDEGIRVLSRRHIECYLYEDTVLKKLCDEQKLSDRLEVIIREKTRLLAESVAKGRPGDSLKPIAGELYSIIKRTLNLTKCGNGASSFMSSTLAPLITPDMTIYKELKEIIFSV